MRFLKLLILAFIIAVPVNVFAGPGTPLTQSFVTVVRDDKPDEEVYTYYDLRNRKTYIQITNDESEDVDALPTLCIHIQIFQQDKECSELNFEDELTPNDTVVYDMDNLIRNDGSEVPINLEDDSYGFVAISAFECGDRNDDSVSDPLLGNVRIIDDSGYEYRMNLVTDRNGRELQEPEPGFGSVDDDEGHIIIPFNTVDGARYADIVGFIVEEDRFANGQTGDGDDYNIYNEEVGITFDVFQVDENEERLSCDQKTFGCGPNVTLNYGINEDYPNSKGGPLLCEGAGLLPGQQHGYISLENVAFVSPLEANGWIGNDFEFVCLAGFNNGDGTGSMDICHFRCDDTDENPCTNFEP